MENAAQVVMNISPLHPASLAALVIFVLSYIAVLFEEQTHLRKSKPVMLGAGLIWIIIGFAAPSYNIDHKQIHEVINHGLQEYASLLLFLLAAMTYIAALQNRNVFEVLRAKLVKKQLTLKQIFWATGFLAFFLSPIADNLTTALVAGAIIMAVGGKNTRFVSLSCISAVNAANAGGVFSPFGDITTLMVWQAGHVNFFEFFTLFIPSFVCFLVPALTMSFFIGDGVSEAAPGRPVLRHGAKRIICLGFFTIVLAVSFEQLLGMPAFLGMMTGLSLLMITAWHIRRQHKAGDNKLDVMELVASVEWDTLLFFFGIIFSVSGLAFLGYLELASTTLYKGFGPSAANIGLGFASAVIDNIPVMFAVLNMKIDMSHFQWLLVTLTTGVGGSLLSVGSAAGVAMMGIARGQYTFFSHLKWTPVLLLGYICAILAHFLVNGHLMEGVSVLTP